MSVALLGRGAGRLAGYPTSKAAGDGRSNVKEESVSNAARVLSWAEAGWACAGQRRRWEKKQFTDTRRS